MSRPSEKALGIAEELLDYVHPGMSRAAAIEEIASMIDEMNDELLEVVTALVDDAEKRGAGPNPALVNHLREIALNYRRWLIEPEGQHDLFTLTTHTATSSTVVAGQMP